MHAYAVITSLLLAVVGTQASAIQARQLPPNDVIPVNIYPGTGCQGNVVRTINVPVGSGCFAVTPVSGSVDSGRVDSPVIPPNSGCQVILWSNTQCTNGNNVPLTNDADGTSQCGTIGNTPIRAIQLVGNCRGA